jgi:hypothetical protein
LVEDDPGLLPSLDPEPYWGAYQAGLVLMFLNEHGLPAAANLLEFCRARARAERIVPLSQVVRISEAIAAGDALRLARAVNTSEAHGLVAHASRMRVVLARRTGDRTQLDLARPVLERLGDRQFLRTLADVAASAPVASYPMSINVSAP